MIHEMLEEVSGEKKSFLASALAGFVIASLLIGASQLNTQDDPYGDRTVDNLTEIKFVEDGVEKSSLKVEIADTDEKRKKGLMFREDLGENRGMLFTWDDIKNRSFWMKNTKIPLDIIFIDEGKRIINIEEAFPQPGANNSELRRYRSNRPAKYVIETDLNYTDRNNIYAGDKVSFSLK